MLKIILTFYENLWIEFFRTLNVPPQLPPFSDLDAISKAVDSKEAGFDPYLNNPFDLKGKTYVYPSIWIHFFEFQSMVGFLVLEWDLYQRKDLLFRWIHFEEL